jgi:hypothetical protein
MIFVMTKRILLGIPLAGVLTAMAACTLVAEMRGTPVVKPAPPAVLESTPQLVPSATASGETRPEFAATPATPAATAAPAASESTAAERAANNVDDPRAVIDWLLNRSSTRGR